MPFNMNDIRNGGRGLDYFGTIRGGGQAFRAAVVSGVNMPTPLTRGEVATMANGANICRMAVAVLGNARRFPTAWTLGVGAVVAATLWYIDWVGRQVPVPESLFNSGSAVTVVAFVRIVGCYLVAVSHCTNAGGVGSYKY
jgi:hypothetical protein